MNGRILLSVLIAMAMTACGPGDENNDDRNIGTDNSNQPNNSNNTNNTNNGTNNTIAPVNNGFGPECAGVECPSDRRCVRGICVLDDLEVACEVAEDLMELVPDMVYAGSADNTQFVDAVSTECATGLEGIYSGAEVGFQFTVPDHGAADFRIVGSEASFSWTIEARTDCTAPGVSFNNDMGPVCSTDTTISIPVEGGQTYYVLVEPNNSIDFGTFDWELVFTPAGEECDAGRTCQGDDVLVCFGGEEFTAACGTGCANDACLGDTCETAIEVTAAMSFSGDVGAYTNALDFADSADCNEDPDDSGGTSTPGEELILSLPGLVAGQTVIVDTSMMNDNVNDVFILDSCSTSANCLAVDSIDYIEWTVEADGDYFVVIDKNRAAQNQPFNYAIDIQ